METVKIVSNETSSGFMIVNKDDFDPAVHKLWKESPVQGVSEADGEKAEESKPKKAR